MHTPNESKFRGSSPTPADICRAKEQEEGVLENELPVLMPREELHDFRILQNEELSFETRVAAGDRLRDKFGWIRHVPKNGSEIRFRRQPEYMEAKVEVRISCPKRKYGQ